MSLSGKTVEACMGADGVVRVRLGGVVSGSTHGDRPRTRAHGERYLAPFLL